MNELRTIFEIQFKRKQLKTSSFVAKSRWFLW